MIASRYLAPFLLAAWWLSGCGGDSTTNSAPPENGQGGSASLAGAGGDSSTGGATGTGGSNAAGSANTAGSAGSVIREGGVRDGAQSGSGPSGMAGVWEKLTVPSLAAGDHVQSVMADPANPGHYYIAGGNNDGRKIKWWRTTDFGDTWVLRNDMAMNGNPWGFSIDPNPDRDPATPPTLYSPAGYGSTGAWKSTDGAATWTRLAGADAAFGPFNPFGTMLDRSLPRRDPARRSAEPRARDVPLLFQERHRGRVR